MQHQKLLKTVLVGGAYVAAFICLEAISQVGIYRSLGVTPWSPASGLALAFAYLRGRSFWPFLVIGELLSLPLLHPLPFSVGKTLMIGLSSAAIWVAAGEVLRHMKGFDAGLTTLRSVLQLVAVACLTALLETLFYVGTLRYSGLLGDTAVAAAVWRDLVGDIVGILVAAPLVLMLQASIRWPAPHEVHLLQLCVLVGALLVIFGVPGATTYQLFYLLFLPVLWIALRDGIVGAVLALNACQVGVIIGADYRVDFNPGLGALQTMMIVLAITGLLIGVTVTEGQATAQRLRDQQTALNRALRLRSAGETAAAIAHQINQPLTAISTYASVASDALQNGNSAFAKTSLDKLSAECDRAATVMRSIRDLVKQGGLTRVQVNLGSLLGEVTKLHSAECNTKGISFDTAVRGNVQTVYCDPVQLQQALYNLINNSVEAIQEAGRNGQIRVTAIPTDDAVAIEVSDDGPGFAPGLETLVGAPFTTTKRNGSGLGLAIARSVAEAHGGSLSILPRDRGATVRLVLPMRKAESYDQSRHYN